MYSKKSALCCAFIAIAILISNCSDSTEPENSAAELIPLKVGNSWNYKLTSYDSSGSISYIENQNSKIIKDTNISNHTWYAYNDAPDGIWYTNKSDGYWAFIKSNTGAIVNDTSVIVFKYPTQVGDIYSNSYMSMEVIAINEELIVSAGVFRTIHIKSVYEDTTNYLLDSFEWFIAPQVGIIRSKQIGKKPNGNKFVVLMRDLESYALE
jgi:hypothetical protein